MRVLLAAPILAILAKIPNQSASPKSAADTLWYVPRLRFRADGRAAIV